MSTLPKDPIILLSYINTKLRDDYKTLDDLCLGLNINKADIVNELSKIDYEYNPLTNKFV